MAPPTTTSLSEAFKGAFRIGAALNASQFTGRDTAGVAIVKTQFNTVTPENILKWESVHPRRGEYDFAAPDRYVEFGRANGMTVIGHTLVWHNQTPRWVFQDPSGGAASRDTLLARMRDHIHRVVGRYKGKIFGWDVVNEAVEEDGSLRRSPWFTIIGPDFIEKAYEYAHEADPSTQLYYNDYSLENAPKRNGAVALIKKLQSEGIHIAAVGLQGHYKLDWPTVAQIDSTIDAFAALGVKVNITELDVDVLPPAIGGQTAEVTARGARQAGSNPYATGLPDSVQQRLAERYAELFQVFMRHRDVIDRVTFWGVGDGDSWLNNWPVRGRTSYPLLFDRQHRPKPAFDAVMRVVRQPRKQ
ncbi:MAG TPA: endo-1,4-beta-xylanase [Gemmatimonadaceae bacterium]|nr:endo-1,4-beta-xylanase [Gemmatimonadaceae bacterium]